VLSDGLWFPRSVHFFSSRFKEGREPAQVVQVRKAEFNRPSHPARLTLNHIGTEDGAVVSGEGSGGKTTGRWDGDRVVSDVEFVQRMVAGELEVGPRQQAAENAAYAKHVGQALSAEKLTADDRQALLTIWARPLVRRLNETREAQEPRKPWTPWEIYVRDFITRYKLDDEQSQKAQLVLTECEERAEIYIDSRKAEILKALDGIQIGSSKIAEADEQEKLRREKVAQLISPLTRIFEGQLRPRLEKLPTRAQRTAAREQ
jgi:hypothetical protein